MRGQSETRWFVSRKPQETPFSAYKFMKREHLDFLLKEQTIRVSRLSYFRNMEAPEWIADKMEGRIEAFVKDVRLGAYSAADPTLLRRLREVGANIGPGTYGTMVQNHKFTGEVADMFVFCASGEPFEQVCRAMTVDAPPAWRYNACVQIGDFGHFFDCILNTGVVTEAGDAPVMQFFRGSDFNFIRYGNKVANVELEDPVPPDHAFLKPQIFASQQEVRFYLNPGSPVSAEHLHIRFRAPRGLLHEKALAL